MAYKIYLIKQKDKDGVETEVASVKVNGNKFTKAFDCNSFEGKKEIRITKTKENNLRKAIIDACKNRVRVENGYKDFEGLEFEVIT